ncbi:rapid alkalinization factor [Rhodamnia argentea]|uniref:Rapid alkalinization factor n=1 Tax=Rhodamnia argentea TaxID=178133 RepID=A0A8B8QE95_9MYRT|nr:rapid alkalinization factor [Rhodamnia argentea]
MASLKSLMICAILIAVAALSVVVAAAAQPSEAGDRTHLGLIPAGGSQCSGSLAECLSEEEEFAMNSESNRRILATSKYISYGALQRNSVPCSRRGASYYNCKPGASSNPYSRGCSTITRCRS